MACARVGIILFAPCGGRRACGKCRVRLLEGQVSGDTPDSEGWVRACAARPLSDITIISPGGELGSNEVSAPENFSAAARICQANGSKGASCGVAIDIGTTTIAARLIDLDTALAIDAVSQLNDQRVYGADVMSRISVARNGKTAELHSLINRQTERILGIFQDRWKLPRIEKLAVSGNTVMLHLFLNADPSGMGELPFTPVFLEAKEISGEALSLPVQTVSLLPSISAFIGGDITAGLAALDILNIRGTSLFIDIGTNGELALAHQGTIYCCSTAAGPAFEGAEISCGIGGIKGAISGLTLAEDSSSIAVTTIGNIPPVGICGSGLIDAVALMLRQKIIDETGFMDGRHSGFLVAPGISISSRDIRQFQLAKSAIYSGIKILCKRAALCFADLQQVFVAGGFGFFINKYNAAETGIFPKECIESLSVCGNLSLRGAELCLSEPDFLEKCNRIIKSCSVIDLAADPSFAEEFAENMLFTA